MRTRICMVAVLGVLLVWVLTMASYAAAQLGAEDMKAAFGGCNNEQIPGGEQSCNCAVYRSCSNLADCSPCGN